MPLEMSAESVGLLVDHCAAYSMRCPVGRCANARCVVVATTLFLGAAGPINVTAISVGAAAPGGHAGEVPEAEHHEEYHHQQQRDHKQHQGDEHDEQEEDDDDDDDDHNDDLDADHDVVARASVGTDADATAQAAAAAGSTAVAPTADVAAACTATGTTARGGRPARFPGLLLPGICCGIPAGGLHAAFEHRIHHAGCEAVTGQKITIQPNLIGHPPIRCPPVGRRFRKS